MSMVDADYDIPAAARLRIYLDTIPSNCYAVGGEIASNPKFKETGDYDYTLYSPNRHDMEEILHWLGALWKENRAMRYGDSAVINDNIRKDARIQELEEQLRALGTDPAKLPAPRVPIDIAAHAAFGE